MPLLPLGLPIRARRASNSPPVTASITLMAEWPIGGAKPALQQRANGTWSDYPAWHGGSRENGGGDAWATVRALQERLLAEQTALRAALDLHREMEAKVKELEARLSREQQRTRALEAALSGATARLAMHDGGASAPAQPCGGPGSRDGLGQDRGSASDAAAGMGPAASGPLNGPTGKELGGPVLRDGSSRTERRREPPGAVGLPRGGPLVPVGEQASSPSTWDMIAGLLVEKRESRSAMEHRLTAMWQQMGEEMGALAAIRSQEEGVMLELMSYMGQLLYGLPDGRAPPLPPPPQPVKEEAPAGREGSEGSKTSGSYRPGRPERGGTCVELSGEALRRNAPACSRRCSADAAARTARHGVPTAAVLMAPAPLPLEPFARAQPRPL